MADLTRNQKRSIITGIWNQIEDYERNEVFKGILNILTKSQLDNLMEILQDNFPTDYRLSYLEEVHPEI